LVTLSEMQMRRGQDEAALQTLEQLDASGDLNSRGLELMARFVPEARPAASSCVRSGRGCSAQRSCPRKRSTNCSRRCGSRRFAPRASAQTPSQLEKAWSDLPRAVRKLPHSIITYARAAMACRDHQGASEYCAS